MKRKVFLMVAMFIIAASPPLTGQSHKVSVLKQSDGMTLTVDDKAFMINGMNWDYIPIGQNYSYSLWTQPEEIIKEALDGEMALLKNMGVNVIRQYTGVPAKWISYIYDEYGIYTMLNHSFGRYGVTLNGSYITNTDYANPNVQEQLLKEVSTLVQNFKDTRGLLMFLLGNENNYGLFWDGAETEDIPIDKRKSTVRAKAMYKLFNEAAKTMKAIDKSHPIAICNGDLLFLDIIKEECKDFDIFGTNMYRGQSFRDAFERVRSELNMPIMFTEFGADAFNVIDNAEDQKSQSYYLYHNWKEIYTNASAIGGSRNSIGGFTFQFSDGWWKYGQTEDLDIHDNNASWSNGGYPNDFVAGENNMNEEWFGICAKGPTNARGLYDLYPRAAYYMLKDVHEFSPYAPGESGETLDRHFGQIQLLDGVMKARADKAALEAQKGGKIGISELRGEFTTFVTGGELTTTPENNNPNTLQYPNRQGFDYMESYFVGIEGKPNESFRANVTFSILGNVAENPINEIFYENRGRVRTLSSQNGNLPTSDLNRIQVYQAEYTWHHKSFDLKGFYRTGHYHWGYEGDFFGLYREANYGPNIDIYNGLAPNGFELEGKKKLKGLTVAYGPELWWAANPAVFAKYSKEVADIKWTVIFHEDVDNAQPAVSSIAVPQPKTRRATLHAEKQLGKLGIEIGGIWGGQPLVGREFQVVRGSADNYEVLADKIRNSDTWGGKIKLTYTGGSINWYGQASSLGLVARGGSDQTQTFTGWKLRDPGSGNLNNVLSGFTYTIGNLQIGPNFMWQKPLIDPIPSDAPAPARPRNIIDDPFSVRSNRETVAGEILFTYDLTPGTWMYEWDNDRKEDAKLAVSAGFVYRHFPTSQDAAIGILGDGRTIFTFPGAAPAANLWEAHSRIVSKWGPDFGWVANFYGGEGQANGSDQRIINRFGGDIKLIYKKVKLLSHVKVNDWGPFDYHRDFNLTYPLQLMADVSTTLGKPDWFVLPNTQFGMRFMWRSLDEFSPRYNPTQALDAVGNASANPTAFGFPNGNEWEFRTYLHINVGR